MRTLNPLERLITCKIRSEGPLGLADFMALALGHPEHGYYMKKNPFGAGADFITAPDVSQMFGEMIGLWCADIWTQMAQPTEFIFLECGPGRGTLMSDMLRITTSIRGFQAAAKVHFLEISPTLISLQKQTLSQYEVTWHKSLDSVPKHLPIIMVANEFLDALPVIQMQKDQGIWRERTVDVQQSGLCFSLRNLDPSLFPPKDLQDAPEGSVYEISPQRSAFVAQLCHRLKMQRGTALLIDYGHCAHSLGDTFQAVKNHSFSDPFMNVGDSDLTSHVDFRALVDVAKAENVSIGGLTTQGGFLKTLGIEIRAEKLMQARQENAEEIKKALHRLTDSSQMGELFKVLCLSEFHEKSIFPAGF